MFSKGTMRDEGIDITLKNNPSHFLSPDDWDMVMKARFGKISREEYKTWYLNLIRDRWESRRQEFLDLAKEGLHKDIKLKCFCSVHNNRCHAFIAASFMNAISNKIKNLKE